MFKFWLYLALCVSLIFYGLSVHRNPKLEIAGAGELCIYSTETVSSPLIKKRLNTGIVYIYYIDSFNAAEVRKLFKHIDGESITFAARITAEEVLENLGYLQVSSYGDGVMEVVYAYSPRGSSSITVGNTKINLQIATRKGAVTAGWPVILGSY